MKISVLIPCILATFYATAQTSKKVEDHQMTINALFPGVAYEYGLNHNNTIRVDAGVSVGAISFNGSGLDLFPRLDAQFRKYYNLERRLSKNKTISSNSGNFYGLHSYYTFNNGLLGTDFDPDLLNIILFGPAAFETFYVGATYGMQRTYTNRFNWGLQLGLGVISVVQSDRGSAVTVTTDGFAIYPNLRVTMGWVMGSRKK